MVPSPKRSEVVAKARRLPLLFGSELFKKINPKLVLSLALGMWALVYVTEWYRDQLIGQAVSVDVETVLDGDTFTASVPSVTYWVYPVKARFRLRGIDAPEFDQPYSHEARQVLESLIHPRGGLSNDVEVVCRVWGKDTWGRYIADVVVRRALYTQVINVQEELVRLGAAWTFPSFAQHKKSDGSSTSAGSRSLEELMNEAKEKKLGLWRATHGVPEAPWIHRQIKREKRGVLGGPSFRAPRQRGDLNQPHDDRADKARDPRQFRKAWHR